MRRVWLFALLLAPACGSTTDEGGIVPQVVGDWEYRALQASPPLEINGELRIEEQDGSHIEGELEAHERDAQGIIRNRVGYMNGRVLSNGTIDFDVFLDGTARRHVGTVRADSMSGDWTEPRGTSAPLTGTFSAKR